MTAAQYSKNLKNGGASKIALLDFDDVLFNTREFIRMVRKRFCSSGVDEKDFDSIYKKFRAQLVSVKKTYHQDEFIQHLKSKRPAFDSDTFVKSFKEFIVPSMKTLVYEDAEDFIGFLKQNRWRIVVVSSGHPDWQRKKIFSSGIGGLADEVILTKEGSKLEAIKTLFSENSNFEPRQTIFVDDNYTGAVVEVKKNFPAITVFQLVRPELSDKREKAECDHFCRSLDEITNLI